jgi:hypothetical protein
LQEASQVLGRDVRTLDTEQALSSTVPVQLALFVSGVATTRIMQAEGVEPDVVAGLSVGFFAASVAVGMLPFKDGLSRMQIDSAVKLIKGRKVAGSSLSQKRGFGMVDALDFRSPRGCVNGLKPGFCFIAPQHPKFALVAGDGFRAGCLRQCEDLARSWQLFECRHLL